MNTSNQQNAPGASTPASGGEVSGTGIIKNYDQRAAEAFGELTGEVDGGAVGAQPVTPAGENAAPPSPPLDEAGKRAERRKAIAAAMAEERQRVDARSRFQAVEADARRATSAERERDELKQQIAQRIDPSSLDEAGFFALAERLQVPAKKLGEWLSQRSAHPEVIAAQQAQKVMDPKIQALEAKLDEQNALIQQINTERMTESQTQEAYGRGEAMLNFTQGAAAQAPYAMAFLNAHGANEFLTLANSAYEGVPKGAGWEQHVLDAIEDKLTELSKIFQPSTNGSQQQRQAPPTQHQRGAAQPMTTVSNTLAQGRASVVADEEADWAALPYEERAARLFRNT